MKKLFGIILIVLLTFTAVYATETTIFTDGFEGTITKWPTRGSKVSIKSGIGYNGSAGLEAIGASSEGYIQTASLSLNGKISVIKMRFKMTKAPTANDGIRVYLRNVSQIKHDTLATSTAARFDLFKVNSGTTGNMAILPTCIDNTKTIAVNKWYEIIVKIDVSTPYSSWIPYNHTATFTLISEDGEVDVWSTTAYLDGYQGYAINNLNAPLQLYAVSGDFIADDVSVTTAADLKPLAVTTNISENQSYYSITKPITLTFNREVKLAHDDGGKIYAKDGIKLKNLATDQLVTLNAGYKDGDKKVLVCTFPELAPGTNYSLIVDGITDYYDRICPKLDITFTTGTNANGFYISGDPQRLNALEDGTVIAKYDLEGEKDVSAVMALYEKLDGDYRLVKITQQSYSAAAFPADNFVTGQIDISGSISKDYILKFLILSDLNNIIPHTEAMVIDTEGENFAEALPKSSVFKEIGFETSDQRNNEFWQATGGTNDTKYTTPSGSGKNGSYSLLINRTDSTKYSTVVTRVPYPITGGSAFYVSTYMKSENVINGRGTIVLDVFGEGDAWITGHYTDVGITGTNDWTYCETEPFVTPLDAKTVRITLYLTSGATGKVWYDDISLYRMQSDLMDTILLTPAYKGLIYSDSLSDISLTAIFNNIDYSLGGKAFSVKLTDSSGHTVNRAYSETISPYLNVTFPAAGLAPGKYTLTAAVLTAGNNRIIEKEEWKIDKKAPGEAKPKVYVNEDGILLKDGVPFFMKGLYTGPIVQSDIATIAAAGFNTVMSYSDASLADLNILQNYNINAIYSVKDAYVGSAFCPPEIKTAADGIKYVTDRVKLYKDHPALLAWYINDEQPLFRYADDIKAHRDAIEELDINHPSYGVDYKIAEAATMTNLVDLYGTDPYPITGGANDRADMVAEWTRAAADAFPNRPLWQVLQASNLGNYGNPGYRPPNKQELMGMLYQAVCEGARGILYYSYFDLKTDIGGRDFATLWAEFSPMAAELSRIEPIVLSTEPAPHIGVSGGAWLRTLTKKYNGKTYLFAANVTKTSQSATFTAKNATSVLETVSNRGVSVNAGGVFTDTIPGMGAMLYEITQPGTEAGETGVKTVMLCADGTPLIAAMTDGVTARCNGYTVTVPNGTASFTALVETVDSGAVYAVNGQAGDTVAINDGTANVTVEITARDGETKRVMTVTMIRP